MGSNDCWAKIYKIYNNAADCSNTRLGGKVNLIINSRPKMEQGRLPYKHWNEASNTSPPYTGLTK